MTFPTPTLFPSVGRAMPPRFQGGFKPARDPGQTPAQAQDQAQNRPTKQAAAQDKFRQQAEQHTRKVEFSIRKLGNWWFQRRYGEQIDQIYNVVKDLDANSPQYIPTITFLAKIIASFYDMEIEINTEHGELKNIVDADEACIFIMNHDNQGKDPAMLAAFAGRLYDEYAKAGKTDNAPRGKVILNEDILLSQGQKVRTIYEKLGAIGVDASIHGSGNGDGRTGKAMLSVLKNFNQDEAHVFLFPEGRLSAHRHLPLNRKFQPGVGDIIRQAARRKKRVKIVPLGFAYDKANKQALGSIHIGQPVYFTLKDDKMLASLGNVTSDVASPEYQQFFHNKRQRKYSRREFLRLVVTPLSSSAIKRENDARNPAPPQPFQLLDGVPSKVLRNNQLQPVSGKELKFYISDVLAENLRICREKSLATCRKIKTELTTRK